MNFLVLSGKIISFFPKNIILFFRRKMKVDLSEKKKQKKHGNILFSANILKRWSF